MSKVSPTQLKEGVTLRIWFMFLYTNSRHSSTRSEILRKEAETRMEMTLADSRVGFSAGSECFVQHLYGKLMTQDYILAGRLTSASQRF